MKILNLTAENFKILRAVEITPDGSMVTIGGRNGQGKSSILDAIWVALAGRSAAPPKPIREGEEKATIKLDLGDLIVTRTFTEKEGSKYTDTVKVEDADGRRYPKPQTVLDALLGEIGFDPFDFVQKKPHEQAEILMEMVPLSVDLDELAADDSSDYEKRRDVNRDIKLLEGQLAGIPKEDIPEDAPNRSELVARLGSAADTNGAIDREARRREDEKKIIDSLVDKNDEVLEEIAELEDRLADLKEQSKNYEADIDKRRAAVKEWPELDEKVNTDELRDQLDEADEIAAKRQKQEQRAALVEKLTALREESQGYTDAMEQREKEREAALAEAEMPIEGLGFAVDDNGKPIVTYEGLPFDEDQISTAAALRVSTAIAMAANPQLRVLRIKDGSLLDDDAMALLAEMAEAEDYQLWIERVGTGGVGIVIEAGQIKEMEKGEEN